MKEVSKGIKSYQEECGITSGTNENCMGDYDEDKNEMIHRKNYSSGENLFPNSYLGNNNFTVYPDMSKRVLTIGNYKNNWNVLFNKLYEILQTKIQNIKGNQNKGNIYISTHQHCLQQKFFNLKRGENGKKYGFRNCTVIKVELDQTNNVNYEVVHVPQNEDLKRNKTKYQYFNKNDRLNDYLIENTFINEGNIGNSPTILNHYNIYFIRHGEALHNLSDYIKENPQHEKSKQENIILNKLTKRKGVRFTGYRFKPKFFINSCLTDIGVEQAKEIIEKLYDEFSVGKSNDEVFISSPMDRTIETLINATTTESQYSELKNKFNTMRQRRFGDYEKRGRIQRLPSKSKKYLLNGMISAMGARTAATSAATSKTGFRMPERMTTVQGGNKRTYKNKRKNKNKKTYKKIKLNKKKHKKTRRRKRV